MDISELFATADDFNAGAEFTMTDPYGKPTDLKIVLAGPFSAQFRAAKDQHSDKMIALRGRTARTKAIPTSETEDAFTEFLSHCILGWHGMTENGQPLIRTDVSALRVLKAAPWIREQVATIIDDKQAFRKSQSTAAKVE